MHSATNVKPSDVNRNNARQLFDYLESKRSKQYRQTWSKLHVGDVVRIPRKNIKRFEKGFTPKWSTELYQIYQIHHGARVFSFTLINSKGVKLDRRYYEKELNLVMTLSELKQRRARK